MKTVLSVDLMRKSDAYTIKHFVSGKELMFRAGKAVFDSVDWFGKVAIVCGSGNNAGDGYVLALLLNGIGIDCELLRLNDRTSADGDFYYQQCKKAAIAERFCDENTHFDEYDFIVDCIFGTGFKGELDTFTASIVDKINASSSQKICVDINSGLDGDSGMTKKCVLSDLTVSIGFLKSGHLLNMAKDCIAELKNCDIGIQAIEKGYSLIENSDIAEFLKERKSFCHKGDWGYVALIGGSGRYPGAVKLANLSLAALRSGCGVSRLVVPKTLAGAVAPHILESTLFSVSDNDGNMVFVKEEFEQLLKGVTAVAVGVGWGQSAANYEILEYLITEYSGTLIIDADGLNILADMDNKIYAKAKAKIVLTPHLKEFERLCGIPRAAIQSNPIKYAKDFARQFGVILLLKGVATIVTDGERVLLSDRGGGGMATAGSGDVLSGAALGVCGWGKDTLESMAAAAYITGVAGELAQKEKTDIAMTAGDTAAFLPRAIRAIREKKAVH
jgi:NAD(P)H-hydrate epimerase